MKLNEAYKKFSLINQMYRVNVPQDDDAWDKKYFHTFYGTGNSEGEAVYDLCVSESNFAYDFITEILKDTKNVLVKSNVKSIYRSDVEIALGAVEYTRCPADRVLASHELISKVNEFEFFDCTLIVLSNNKDINRYVNALIISSSYAVNQIISEFNVEKQGSLFKAEISYFLVPQHPEAIFGIFDKSKISISFNQQSN